MRLVIKLVLAAALTMGSSAFAAPDTGGLASSPEPVGAVSAEAAIDYLRGLSATGKEQVADSCCKRCSKGKACGDSCISRDRSCKKGPGCACD